SDGLEHIVLAHVRVDAGEGAVAARKSAGDGGTRIQAVPGITTDRCTRLNGAVDPAGPDRATEGLISSIDGAQRCVRVEVTGGADMVGVVIHQVVECPIPQIVDAK